MKKLRGSSANFRTQTIGLAQNLIFNQSTPRQQKSNIELVKPETVENGLIYLETVKLKKLKNCDCM